MPEQRVADATMVLIAQNKTAANKAYVGLLARFKTAAQAARVAFDRVKNYRDTLNADPTEYQVSDCSTRHSFLGIHLV